MISVGSAIPLAQLGADVSLTAIYALIPSVSNAIATKQHHVASVNLG
jgi:hypothetical protein